MPRFLTNSFFSQIIFLMCFNNPDFFSFFIRVSFVFAHYFLFKLHNETTIVTTVNSAIFHQYSTQIFIIPMSAFQFSWEILSPTLNNSPVYDIGKFNFWREFFTMATCSNTCFQVVKDCYIVSKAALKTNTKNYFQRTRKSLKIFSFN